MGVIFQLIVYITAGMYIIPRLLEPLAENDKTILAFYSNEVISFTLNEFAKSRVQGFVND